MISHINIKNFAIIKDLDLDFTQGLNIITGETGSGKSIIIEAISMALGARADTDYVRTGCDKASITIAIDDECGNDYVIKREISLQGKNLCKINGEMVTVGELSMLCKKLADIHGQYDNQSLLNPDNHTAVLDMYGGKEIEKVKLITADSYKALSDVSAELKTIKNRLGDSERQRDIFAYELNEIDSANVLPNEDEQLSSEINIMQNSEALYESLTKVSDLLFHIDGCSVDTLGQAMHEIQSVEEYADELNTFSDSISNAYYSINDLSGEIRSFIDSISFSEEALNEKIERSDYIEKLKRKYGPTINDIYAYREKAAKTIELYSNSDEKISELESKMILCKEAFDAASQRLNKLRQDAALHMEKAVTRELSDLNFSNAVFSVKLSQCSASENGTSCTEFKITTNKGEDSKPLAKIASGGELSRIMLALKRITGDLDHIPTMIFDEIDTGISGATAGIVGEKLKSISKNHQIICITHLPQIAALGDSHYKIQKTSDSAATYTTVVPLDKEQSVEELARLLSGTEITDEARNQARKLIQG